MVLRGDKIARLDQGDPGWRNRFRSQVLLCRVPKCRKGTIVLGEQDAMPNSDPQKTVLKRVIGSKSVQVAADKAGRICLPDEMAKAAGIKDEAVLVGLLDRFEIWNPAAHAKLQSADEVMAHEAFKLME